jgi:hypothetical protein
MLWTSSVGSGRWFTFAARGAGPACCLLAEAGDVGVRWSCVPVCHTRESALVDGAVENSPETVEEPSGGLVLVCYARPTTSGTLDL